jgi:hypothetical protein
MAVLELAMLLVFSQIAAQNAATQLIGGGAAGKWLRHVGEYMVVSVLPYALPFVVALGVHGALREAVFEWTQGALATAAPTPAPAGPPRTSKKKRS